MIKSRADGAVLLGASVSCDGFACDRKLRVQTHIHSDHLVGFGTSKANQTILCTPETRELLVAIFNAEMAYRNNLVCIGASDYYTYNGETIELVPSGHMLGSSQVRVVNREGQRVGYSSDFCWPLSRVIEVDELCVDSTFGDPAQSRTYCQDDVEAKLISVACEYFNRYERVCFVGHQGRLHAAMHLLAEFVPCPVVCSPRAFAIAGVYQRNGSALPTLVSCDSDHGRAILRGGGRCVAFVSLPEQRRQGWLAGFRKVMLSAHPARLDDPLMIYDNGDCCVSFTDHANFEETLAYIQQTGARKVYTDPRSGNAEALAMAIKVRLGIEACVLERDDHKGWG